MPVNEFEENILKNVDEYGFSSNHVFDPDGNDKNFTYSIGFPLSLNCPDFIVFGLSRDIMHNMLWEIFHQVRAGRRPEDDMGWQGLLGGDYVCVSKRLHPSQHNRNYLNSSIWHHKYSGFPVVDFSAFQMVRLYG